MSEVDWEAIRIEAEIVFGLVASLNNNKDDEVMHKDELIKAHHGDFHLFDELDFDSDGRVTSEEWHAFLKRNHAEKAHKGDEWLRSMFHTLRQNIEQDGNSQSEPKAKAEGPHSAGALTPLLPTPSHSTPSHRLPRRWWITAGENETDGEAAARTGPTDAMMQKAGMCAICLHTS